MRKCKNVILMIKIKIKIKIKMMHLIMIEKFPFQLKITLEFNIREQKKLASYPGLFYNDFFILLYFLKY